jgi:methylglyoxal reductase
VIAIPRRDFPALGQQISQLGYGSYPLGGAFGSVDEGDVARSVFAYLEAGGNFIDTARHYGRAEEVLGGLLKRWSGVAPVVATKVLARGPMRKWGAPLPVDVVFPPGHIRESVEESLRNLRLDSIDLIQLHVYWPGWGTDGYWLDELEELRSRGLARAIGVSIPDYRHDNALPLVLSGRIDSVQTIVNVFDPLALDNLAPIAQQAGVAVIARGVLDEGGLTDQPQTGRHYEVDDLRHRYFSVVDPSEYDSHTARLKEYLPQYAGSLPELALRAVLGHPAITTAILSMPSDQLVKLNVQAAVQPPLPADVLDRLWTRHRWVRNFFEADYWSDA